NLACCVSGRISHSICSPILYAVDCGKDRTACVMARRTSITLPVPHEDFLILNGMGTRAHVAPLKARMSHLEVAVSWRHTQMSLTSRSYVFGTICVLLLLIGVHTNAFGRGGSGGSMGRPPGGIGMDRGLGRAFEASGGRADMGRITGAEQSHGRSDVGL